MSAVRVQRCKATEQGVHCDSAATVDGFCDNHAAIHLRDTQPIHHQAVTQCTFEWVPTTKPGSRIPDWKRCSNAILAPATFCHAHGGAIASSVALPIHLATKAVAHNQLALPSPAYWETPTARMERTQGRGWLMFSENPVLWSNLWVHTTGETMRVGDRVSAISHYLVEAVDTNVDSRDLPAFIAERIRQPHLPGRRWTQLGRNLPDPSRAVMSSRKVPYNELEFAAGWTTQQAWGYTAMNAVGTSVPYPLYPFDATDGGPVNATFSRVGRHIPARTGLSVDEALEVFEGVAQQRGWRLVFGIHQPETGVANFERQSRVAQVFGRIGDKHTRLHAVAHTAGHIAMGHSACGDDRRVPHETDAETWAYLALARLGMLTEAAAAYWRSTYNVNLRIGTFATLRAAAATLDWTIS